MWSFLPCIKYFQSWPDPGSMFPNVQNTTYKPKLSLFYSPYWNQLPLLQPWRSVLISLEPSLHNCVLCTVYCGLCTVYCVLCSLYCILYCILYSMYCVLCNFNFIVFKIFNVCVCLIFIYTYCFFWEKSIILL